MIAKTRGHQRLYEIGAEVQAAVADVQLFGSVDQVAAVQDFARSMAANKHADPDHLLILLRNDLRSELELQQLDPKVWWLRVDGPKNEP